MISDLRLELGVIFSALTNPLSFEEEKKEEERRNNTTII